MPEYMIGTRRYPTKKAREEAVRDILRRYRAHTVVENEEDDLLLRDLLNMHPDAEEKIGPGVDYFRVIKTPRGNHNGPEAVHINGHREPFSYMKCLQPPSHAQRVRAAMRTEIEAQVNSYFESRRAAGTLVSDESGAALDPADTHVSYFRGPRFHDLATQFIADVGGWEAVELTSETERGLALFTDRQLGSKWQAHHQEHAVLGLLTSKENLRRPCV
ncbi:DUF3223 domain-containing protein [Streptomyces zhaozhouensis]|uniref:DUF3223 domain-containing protein n=1 Tax=Streptomyces zhaozhouensis TaxID=1300267 RepID=UPI001FEA1112|nr:DUF3223 domain-containing protein [Streptomyces zhaozhouensis]